MTTQADLDTRRSDLIEQRLRQIEAKQPPPKPHQRTAQEVLEEIKRMKTWGAQHD